MSLAAKGSLAGPNGRPNVAEEGWIDEYRVTSQPVGVERFSAIDPIVFKSLPSQRR